MMKKFNVFLVALLVFISSSSMALAQEDNATKTQQSDLVVEQKENVTKKRPAPIKRAHIVEDYLPILGKQMRAQGMRPPKPFFVSAIYYHMQIPQTITNAVGYGFNPPVGIDKMDVRMENAKVVTNSGGVRAGFNLLPFLSIFGVYMHTEGYSEFTAVVDGIWGIMDDGYMLNQKIDFKADTGAIGVALSYGFRLGRVVPFAVLNTNYAWTTTNMTDQVINTLIASARVGINVPLPKDMRIAFHVGTQYQYLPMGNKRTGQYTVKLDPGIINGSTEPIIMTSKYSANAENASPWAMNAGILFSPSRYFDIITEFGFLSRFTAMVAVQANF